MHHLEFFWCTFTNNRHSFQDKISTMNQNMIGEKRNVLASNYNFEPKIAEVSIGNEWTHCAWILLLYLQWQWQLSIASAIEYEFIQEHWTIFSGFVLELASAVLANSNYNNRDMDLFVLFLFYSRLLELPFVEFRFKFL